MDNELMEKIFKTKSGKIGIVFLILSALSLCTCFIKIENIGTGILGCFLFFFVSGCFLYKGRKEVEKNSDNISTDNYKTSVSIPKKEKFKPTKKVEKYIFVDDKHKKWCLPKSKQSKAIYNYSDILDYELIEDGGTVTSGSLGRAIAGGLAFGSLGSVIGGMSGKQKPTCHKLQIKITVKDMKHPALFINFIDYEVKKDSLIYKDCINSAQEIISLLQLMKTVN